MSLKKEIPLQVLLTEEMHEILRDSAHASRVSMGELIRRCIDKSLDEVVEEGKQ